MGNIIGLRNKLAHDYGEILAERIWNISKTSVPSLLIEIEKIEELKEYIKKVSVIYNNLSLKKFYWIYNRYLCYLFYRFIEHFSIGR
ncbi:HepT-like ribonuclease domain-containing protein [Treponema primitia]|uniref:HepT-like ribonuclease domain-containing protein n=1 Tax=Treponema primitia TaxID=88058 RepID=UPI0002F8F0AF